MDQFGFDRREFTAIQGGGRGRIPTASRPLTLPTVPTHERHGVLNMQEEVFSHRVKDEFHGWVPGSGGQFFLPLGFEQKSDFPVSNCQKSTPDGNEYYSNGYYPFGAPMPDFVQGQEWFHGKVAQPQRGFHGDFPLVTPVSGDEKFVNDLLAVHQSANKPSPIGKNTPTGYGSGQALHKPPGFERRVDSQVASSLKPHGIPSQQLGAPLLSRPGPSTVPKRNVQDLHHQFSDKSSSIGKNASTECGSGPQPSSAAFGYPSSSTGAINTAAPHFTAAAIGGYNGYYTYPQLPHELYSQQKQSYSLYPPFPHDLYSQKRTQEAAIGSNGMSTRSSVPVSRKHNCSSAMLKLEQNGYTDHQDVFLAYQRLKNCIDDLPEDSRQVVLPLLSDLRVKLVRHILRATRLEVATRKNAKEKENDPDFHSRENPNQLIEQQPAKQESGSDESDVNSAVHLQSEEAPMAKEEEEEEEEPSLEISSLQEEGQLISDATDEESDEESELETGRIGQEDVTEAETDDFEEESESETGRPGDEDDREAETGDDWEDVSIREDDAKLNDWVCI